MRRQRREAESGEFRDPLNNFDAPVYSDELEKSLCEESLLAMRTRPVTVVPPEMTVESALRKMVDLDIACLMIAGADGRLQGLFSERDVLDRVAIDFDRVRSLPVSEVMTRQPMVAHETDSPAKVMNLMAVTGFRHVPVLDVDDRIVGIVGPRRVIDYLQKYFESH